MATNATNRGLPGTLPVMTSLQESGLRNLNYGDSDSIGYFQQRKRYYAHPGNPTWSLDRFLDDAKKTRKYPETAVGLGKWAQAVQRSAYPDAYKDDFKPARKLIGDQKYYGEGGIPGKTGGKKMLLEMPSRIRDAFVLVAATLRRMAGKGGSSLDIENGSGRVTDGITAIAGEAGAESIVPLTGTSLPKAGKLALVQALKKWGIPMHAPGGIVGRDGKMGFSGPGAGLGMRAHNKYWKATNVEVGRGNGIPVRFGTVPGALGRWDGR